MNAGGLVQVLEAPMVGHSIHKGSGVQLNGKGAIKDNAWPVRSEIRAALFAARTLNAAGQSQVE